MKNLFGILAVVTLLAVASPVLADEATTTEAVYVAPIRHGNGDPKQVMNVWGLTGYQTPWVASGTTVTDTFNIKATCPFYFNVMGCSNLSTVKYYVNKMIASGFKEVK